MTAEHRIARLSWEQVEIRLRDGAAALLPIGAGAKEHGLHLPMNTDEVQAEWLAAALAAEFDLLVWPTVTYGHYPAFTDFPGSISLSRHVFVSMMRDIISGIARFEPAALFVLDTGISTLEPVAEAIASCPWKTTVVHLRIHDGLHYRTTAERLRQQSFGSHADELETSRMLVIDDTLVKMGNAVATPAGPIAGPLTRTNAPSGSYGDPLLASAVKGQEILKAMFADLREIMHRSLAR